VLGAPTHQLEREAQQSFPTLYYSMNMFANELCARFSSRNAMVQGQSISQEVCGACRIMFTSVPFHSSAIADFYASIAVKPSKSTSRQTTNSAMSQTLPSRATSTVPLPLVRRRATSRVPRVRWRHGTRLHSIQTCNSRRVSRHTMRREHH
jgi:hypothetical protein